MGLDAISQLIPLLISTYFVYIFRCVCVCVYV